jgi:hypothetical protein
VAQLNATVDLFPELEGRSAAWLLLNPGKLPEDARHAVRDCAGGHVNHSLFWRGDVREGRGCAYGHLADAIARNFGSFETFKMPSRMPRPESSGRDGCGSHARSRMRAATPVHDLRHNNPLLQGIFRSWSTISGSMPTTSSTKTAATST